MIVTACVWPTGGEIPEVPHPGFATVAVTTIQQPNRHPPTTKYVIH
jgi:hypothetical protein